MNKSYENGKATFAWFGIVDILIILILAGFIASLFLIDKTGGGDDEKSDDPRLTFAVAVQDPYDVDLFLQEGKGQAIPLRFNENETAFGWLLLGDDGQFYVECAGSMVRASEDLSGLWYLEDTMLLNGTVLSVQSKLADFSVTLLTLPELLPPGSAGTTEPIPEQPDEPLDSEGDAEDDIPADAEVNTALGGGEAGSGEITADTTENELESAGS